MMLIIMISENALFHPPLIRKEIQPFLSVHI